MNENAERPLISVIIPVYKTAPSVFERCLRSLAHQGLPDDAVEAIVVYDGEPDAGLRSVAQDVPRQGWRLNELLISHNGVSAARNAGIEAASGHWLTFLDSDDELMSGALAKMLSFAEGHCCDIVFSDFVKLLPSGKEETCRYAEKSLAPSETLQIRLRSDVLKPQTSRGTVWGKLYSAELAASLRFDESLEVAEDALFAVQAMHASKRAGYLKEDVYLYCRNQASATVAWRADYVQRMVLPIGKMRELTSSWPDVSSYEEDIDDLALFHLMLVLVHYICNPDAPWSGARRKAEYRHVLSIPEFKEPLARADLSVFSLTRRTALFSMRHGVWPMSRAIGYVRQRQLRGSAKGVE